jgi:hypothetical protein
MPQIASAGENKPSSFWINAFKSNIARMGKLLLVVDEWNNTTCGTLLYGALGDSTAFFVVIALLTLCYV